MTKEKDTNLNNTEEVKNELDQEVNKPKHDKKSSKATHKQQKEVDEANKIKEKLTAKETKILELLAEKENLTKRLEKEKQEFIKYRAGSFLNQVIPSIDMMEKVLGAKNVSPEVENWLKGFEMIFNNFITSMEKEGVKIITIKPGDYYDPKYHHAIDEQYSDDFKPGQIIKAHNQAYLLHDRLLRPANVVVAKSKNNNIDIKNESIKEEEKNG